MNKKKIRSIFRNEVFKRDNYTCKGCNRKFAAIDLDAHHIIDRNEMPNGGYVKENGISLCRACHLKAEKYHITNGKEWEEDFHPNDLFDKINSSKELAIQKSETLNGN